MARPNSFFMPVTEAEKAMKAPVVDKDAGVEALFWRVAVSDDLKGQDVEREIRHYVRLKVFSEKGKQELSNIEIEVSRKRFVSDIQGRTIRPDGSIVELTRDAIHDREAVRVGSHKVRVKSFAMPNVEVGAIVEYRWVERRIDESFHYFRAEFQHEYPVQHSVFEIRPLSSDYVALHMSAMMFNCKPVKGEGSHVTYTAYRMENVPAVHDEPMMPSKPNIRPWLLVMYTEGERREPDKYWHKVGKDAYNRIKLALKVDDAIRTAAKNATDGVATPEQKVAALIRYLRKDMRLLWDRRVSEEERAQILKKMPKDRERTSVEVFRAKIGTDDELNTLFAAMASSIGLDARPAFVANRDELNFAPAILESYFLRNIDMAVQIDGKWRVFDVSARRLPPTMLSWREEGVAALISDPKKSEFVATHVAEPAESTTSRTAKLTLSADGTIEGDVQLAYSGHEAEDERASLEDETPARQQEIIKERLTKQYASAEVSAIQIANVDDFDQPVRVSYHIKLPNFAQRTGKRLLFQPLFFQRGDAPLFAAAERRYDVYFETPWHEHDNITIHWPDGFALDNPENPGNFEFSPVGYYHLTLRKSPTNDLLVERDFVFGKEGNIIFPKDVYSKIKLLFETIHSRDELSMSLKQTAAPAAGSQE